MIFAFHFERWNMIFSKVHVVVKFFIIVLILLCGFTFKRSSITVINDGIRKTSNISISPIEYGTRYVYNDFEPTDYKKVISKGHDGYVLSDTDSVIVEPIDEVIEVGRGKFSVSYGSTTGYGADCVGCSGNVACSTKSGTHNLIRDGIYYNDSKYGNVRIIAADNSLFSCGTVMKIDNGIMDPFFAIVLDTGGAMRNAWSNGNILIDIAFPYENSSGINNATNKSGNVKFMVYRNGW